MTVREQFESDYAVIGDVVTRYRFTAPVEQGDLDVVTSVLRGNLPPGYRVAVTHMPGRSDVSCEIWNAGGIKIYSRFLLVR